ncbi:MAG: hypothetical protein NDI69_13725 [Bacteriovoracaceae bacterium]|nr:hypothetical protein [Bacteriovoracaceae bacterium]
MKILITSGTGTIATELINNLLQAKLKPVIMSHDHKKLDRRPRSMYLMALINYASLPRPCLMKEKWVKHLPKKLEIRM